MFSIEKHITDARPEVMRGRGHATELFDWSRKLAPTTLNQSRAKLEQITTWSFSVLPHTSADLLGVLIGSLRNFNSFRLFVEMTLL